MVFSSGCRGKSPLTWRFYDLLQGKVESLSGAGCFSNSFILKYSRIWGSMSWIQYFGVACPKPHRTLERGLLWPPYLLLSATHYHGSLSHYLFDFLHHTHYNLKLTHIYLFIECLPFLSQCNFHCSLTSFFTTEPSVLRISDTWLNINWINNTEKILIG